VIYVLKAGDEGYEAGINHGLVAAPSDMGSNWVPVGGMAAVTTWESAIAECQNLVLGGYDDWFLPNKTQLNWLYEAKVQGLVGGFADYFYWSSTEYSIANAWMRSFYSGISNPMVKSNTIKVRAVRAF
jgi:hypothetical protein